MLREGFHLLSHKKSLVLRGKQKKINFFNFYWQTRDRGQVNMGCAQEHSWGQVTSCLFLDQLLGSLPLYVSSSFQSEVTIMTPRACGLPKMP